MLGFTQEQLARFGSKLLMVAGGFAAGYLLAIVAGIGYDRLLARKESPVFLHRWLRRIGGVLGALLVGFLVFRGGGFGNGNGTDSGGETPSTGNQAGSGGTEASTNPTTSAIKPTDTAVTLKPLEVTILAGEEVEKNTEKFYRLGGATVSVDRGALLATVTDMQRSTNASVVVVYKFGRDAGTKTIGYTDLETDLKQLKVQFLSEDEFKALARKTP
jgi:hypothetical protein